MTGSYEGKPFTSNYRYIDIYVRKGGTWKIVSVQITLTAGRSLAPWVNGVASYAPAETETA